MEDIENKMKFFKFIWYCLKCAMGMFILNGNPYKSYKEFIVGAITLAVILGLFFLIIFLFHSKK